MAENSDNPVRALPAVHVLLERPEAGELVAGFGRSMVVDAVRQSIAECREALLGGASAGSADPEALIRRAAEMLDGAGRPSLRRVINATGIILHTGLGRAAMPYTVRGRLGELTGYCNVQMDLETGGRIKREQCLRELVHDLTGAESALLVNNNAGATLLVLRALAQGREAVVSRGELIEIGGSFRLPDIMRESGAILREVGATNKTHPRDYEDAIGANTALLLKAHKSNYCIVGFTQEVDIAVIAEIGKRHAVPVVDDLGCGALVDLERFGLRHEMTMRESLEAGADIVLSSTDKLIGGPQGGLIVGRAELLDKMRSHPLYRALRVGKMTLAALEATLRVFRAPERLPQDHPCYAMMAKSPTDLRERAECLCGLISSRCPGWEVTVIEHTSYLGGGSLPGTGMESFAARIVSPAMPAGELAAAFRTAEPPVISRVKDESVILDARTILPEEMGEVAEVAGNVAARARGTEARVR